MCKMCEIRIAFKNHQINKAATNKTRPAKENNNIEPFTGLNAGTVVGLLLVLGVVVVG